MPEPKGELEYLNPYTLLVAVVLSAQATDAGVNKATRPLFAKVDTPQKMLALGEAKAARGDPLARLLQHEGEERDARCRASWSRSTAARCRAIARRWRGCPASGARPRAWC